MVFKNIKKRIVLAMLIIVFFIPQKVSAIDIAWVVSDTSITNTTASASSVNTSVQATYDNFRKDVLNPLVFAVAKTTLKSVVASTIDWINSGFDGNPAYLTDFRGYMTDIADGVVGEFIEGTALSSLCSPFSVDVKLALYQQFTNRSVDFSCTLSGIVDNVETAIDDLDNQWNWGTWHEITQNSNNNAYGTFVDASMAINAKINNKRSEKLEILGWGNGFLSWEECENKDALGEEDPNCSIVTPGSVIMDLGANNLKVGNEVLLTADEINEIIGALFGQLATQVFGDGGFLGMSNSYTSKLGDEKTGDVDSIATEALEYVGNDLDEEENYLNAKEDALDIVEKAEGSLEDLKSCYSNVVTNATANNPQQVWNSKGNYYTPTTAGVKITETERTITNKIDPHKENLEVDIEAVGRIIKTLKGVRDEIVSANTMEELSGAVDGYGDLIASGILHTIVDITKAESESGKIINEMNKLIKDVEKELGDCEDYIYKTDPTY